MKNIKKLKLETIKKLEEVKENSKANNYEKIYCDMVNTMIDYDNEAQDSLYLYDNITNSVDFISEDLIDYQLEQIGNDLDRLRCFIGDTYSSNIYKLDGYGNLENVDDNDFSYCIDEAINTLGESLESKEV